MDNTIDQQLRSFNSEPRTPQRNIQRLTVVIIVISVSVYAYFTLFVTAHAA